MIDKKKIKESILKFLAYIWTFAVPIVIMIIFMLGVLFNLWQVQGLPLWLSIVIALIIGGSIAFGLTKLLKWF